MRIVSVELWHVCMPLKSPWKTAYGSDDAQESVIIKMTNSEGVYAYGEAAPFAAPTYSPEWAGGVFSLIRDWLAPRLLGEEIDEVRLIVAADVGYLSHVKLRLDLLGLHVLDRRHVLR